jgi:hypothetical protein
VILLSRAEGRESQSEAVLLIKAARRHPSDVLCSVKFDSSLNLVRKQLQVLQLALEFKSSLSLLVELGLQVRNVGFARDSGDSVGLKIRLTSFHFNQFVMLIGLWLLLFCGILLYIFLSLGMSKHFTDFFELLFVKVINNVENFPTVLLNFGFVLAFKH